jgi:hypothetical protein
MIVVRRDSDIDGAVAVTGKNARYVRAVPILVDSAVAVRVGATLGSDKRLLVNDSAGCAVVEIREVGNAAVDNRHTDAGSRLADRVGIVRVNGAIRNLIEPGLDLPVGRYIGRIANAKQTLQSGVRNQVVGRFDVGHCAEQLAAQGCDLLVVSLRWAGLCTG